MNDTQTGYAKVNGLEIYYQVHGEGEPLVVLHGAYMTVDAMGGIVPMLAESRKVIVAELQAHGRTADIDRPLSYEHMADDVAALIKHLGIEEADVFGYSMGGGVALQIAMRHPGVVRKLVVASASYAHDGMHSELIEFMPSITPEMFAGSPFEEAYKEIAPNPEDFPALVEKLKALDMTPFEWDISAVEAPTFIIVGDSDVVRLEHIVEMFRHLGGGVFGDMAGLPKSRLAVLPATFHFERVDDTISPGCGMLDRADLLAPMISEFLDAPTPEGG